MHTTPLLTERDSDLRRAIQAVDPEELTIVLPAVAEPARDPKRGLVLAAAGGVVGFGALALLVALVLATSNNSTRPAVVSPPLAPVTQTTTTAPAPPSAEATPVPSASVAPPSPSPVDTAPPTAVVSAEKMAPSVPAQPQDPVRTRLRELFPRLFP